MCGIAGFVRGEESDDLAQSNLARMCRTIAHRGPDHRGTYVDGRVALGNQRLKIVDLANGDQPIFNETGSVVVVYNGEIYNFKDLRKSLEAQGHRFRTNTDTEVLVHLYEEYGTGFLPMLNGMFAFALYDIANDKLILARDRFGIKPLFFAEVRGRLHFASELKAIQELEGFDRALDFEALGIYMSQMFIPQPWTAFKAARRLRAGHFLEVSAGRTTERCYYDIDFSKKVRMSDDEVVSRIIELMSASVEKHLMADVPIGMFLSSGLDSLSILSMAAKHGRPLDSFTLSFDESAYDESSQAKAAATHLGSRHLAVVMRESDFLANVDERQKHSAEPLGPWINVGRMFLARAAREHGLKVVLNGAGGDELFCGYPTINAAMVSRAYQCVPRPVRSLCRGAIGRLPSGDGALPLSFVAKTFANASESSVFRTFFNFKAGLLPRVRGSLLTDSAEQAFAAFSPYVMFEQYKEKVQDLDLVDALQYLDIKCFLEGAVLFLGDNATMAVSLEERVPFLENDLIAFAAQIPRSQKYSLLRVKPLLRKAMRRYLRESGGEEIVRKSRKRGFELPGNRWTRSGAWGKALARRLDASKIKQHGVFRPEAVEALIAEHQHGAANNERILQCILGFSTFLENHV